MPDTTPEIVSFDVLAALEATRSVAGDSLQTFVEFDAEAFNTLYVSETTRAYYEDEAAMLEHFDRIHSYVHLDLVEQDLFTHELFPVADEIRYVSTAMDFLTVVRVYVGNEGIFFAVSDDTEVPAIVTAIEDAV